MARQLSDWLASYMEYTENSEPAKIYHTWVAISTVAAVLKRKCVINWGTLRFFPNMYIVLVGPPGKSRKGTAMSFGKDLLSRAQVKMAAESITREALVREIQQCGDTIIDENNPTEITYHSSLTVVAPELVVFLGYNQQQLMMDLTDWYDCGHGPEGKWTYRTKHQGVDEITGVWVNLIGATTPDLLKSSLSMDAIGGGLTSRIIFVYAANKYKACPAPFLTKDQIALGEKLYYDLEQMHLLKGPFKPDASFIDRWVEWYTKQGDVDLFTEPHLLPYCERRAVHVMKLSMILNAMRSDEMVMTSFDLDRSISILEDAERVMPNVFSGVGKSPHADVLSKVMNTIGLRGEISKSELMRMYYHDADDRVMELIIETLISMRFVTRVLRDGDTILRYSKLEEDVQ